MNGHLDDLPKTDAYRAELDKLPQELRSDYESLVRWYRFLANTHYSHPFVSYKILADLVREGWRQSAVPIQGNEKLESTE